MLGVEQKEGKMWITLKTIFGLEEVLSEELKELGFEHVEILNRAVRVEGTWKDVYYLNLHVRCAISVLVEIKKFRIRNEEDLYERCMKIKWTQYFTKDKTFAVKGAVFSDLFRHSQYPHLVVKDAIADTFRKEFDERPDVNVKSPQVMFDVYIRNSDVTISLNTSGVPLFQRGYREAVGLAPLNEVVAAGLIRMSGWDKKSTFIDPFCGSGTILIEAALMAAGLPPQLERTHFAFKNFANYQPEVWEEILADVPKRVTELPCKIIGSDSSAEMVTKARRNFRGLPIGRFIETSVNTFQELKQIEGPGVMISNPPYGERMGEEVDLLYEELGNWMKGEMKGFNCWVLSSNMEAFKFVGLRPDRKIKVFNGDLECSFRKYSIYEGSKKGKYMDADASEDTEVIEEDPQEEFQGKEHDEANWVKPFSRAKTAEKKPYEKKSFEKKSFDKKPSEKKSFEKKPFEKKPFEKKFEKRESFDRDGTRDAKKGGYEKPAIPRRSTSKYVKSEDTPVEPRSRTKPDVEKTSSERPAARKYIKKDDDSSKKEPETKVEKATPSSSTSAVPNKKVVIETEVTKRPASSKYTKKESDSEEPKAVKPEAKPKVVEEKVAKEKDDVSKEDKPASKPKKESESGSEEVKPISSYKTRSVKDKYGRKD